MNGEHLAPLAILGLALLIATTSCSAQPGPEPAAARSSDTAQTGERLPSNASEQQPSSMSAPSAEQLTAIQANTELVQKMLGEQSGIAFDYSEPSVEWMDGFIERMRTAPEQDPQKLSQVLGSYLGETIRRQHGGRWVLEDDGELGIECTPGFVVYPMAKIEKQFANGEGDSIASFYRSLAPLLAAHRAGAFAPAQDNSANTD